MLAPFRVGLPPKGRSGSSSELGANFRSTSCVDTPCRMKAELYWALKTDLVHPSSWSCLTEL